MIITVATLLEMILLGALTVIVCGFGTWWVWNKLTAKFMAWIKGFRE